LLNKLDDSLGFLKQAMSAGKGQGWGNKENAQLEEDFVNLRRDPRFWALVNEN
jgi:hypothetical protein